LKLLAEVKMDSSLMKLRLLLERVKDRYGEPGRGE
jgi:hypothetical protein